MNALTKARPKVTLRAKQTDAQGKVLFDGIVAPKWKAYINPKYWWYRFSTRNRK